MAADIVEIYKSKWGIASRIGNKIYINKNIKSNSKFYKALLKHELSHSSDITMGDFFLDIKGSHLENVKKEYYSFLFRNPSSWIMFLPIWKYGSEWGFDIMMAIYWILTLIVLWMI
jgi:hypothetical protein